MFAEILFYVLISGTVLYTIYKWATVNKNYFLKRNVKHLEPKLFGNTIGLFMKKIKSADFIDSMYYRFPNEKLIGFFDLREPVYLSTDVDFIRQITIKDFDHFQDHIGFIDDDSDTLFGKGLPMLNDKDWRDMRATLSPAFTGSKMRHMFELVVECAEDMANNFVASSKQGKPIRWEMKDLYSRYTLDVISTSAFGLKVDSLKNPSNEMFHIGTTYTNFTSMKFIGRMLLVRSLPKLMRLLDFELFPKHVRQFFKSMVLDTMIERDAKNIIRPDMINILMHVRKGNIENQQDETKDDDAGFATVEESNIGKQQVRRTWTDDEIVAQCFLFFLAGFETASTLMSFISYELAINQEIQKKLFDEIRQVNNELKGSRLTYDTLSKLKYMDQVISEGLRKWPPAIFTNRKCTKDYECTVNGNNICIENGKQIWIPIYSVHHDSKYYKNPGTFDPERFSDENKHNIKPGTFLPFGIGPRNCIGSRFALMEIKALFFYLLLNFNIEPYEDTQIPLKIANTPMNWVTEKGIHLEFKPRM